MSPWTQTCAGSSRDCAVIAKAKWPTTKATSNKKAHRSRPAAGRHQRGQRAREVHPPRPPLHAASVVGAASAGGGAGGDLRADGRRPLGAPDLFPDREGAGEGAAAAVPHHRGTGAVGEHHQREGACSRRATRSGRAGATPAPRTPTIRARRSCSTAEAARLPRPLRRRRRAAAGSAAAGAGELRQRPQPGGGADQQGDDRDPAEVRRQAAGESRTCARQKLDGRTPGRARRAWPRTCATTASGCATRPRSASATSTPRSRSPRRWRKERPDLKPYVGQQLTVIAWLWARTVKSPNPAFANVDVPLASTFMLSTKAGKEAYVEPVIEAAATASR
jgi:hypothetical protein